jgi:hypothetical protein
MVSPIADETIARLWPLSRRGRYGWESFGPFVLTTGLAGRLSEVIPMKAPKLPDPAVGPFSSQRNGATRNSSKGIEHQRALDLHDKAFETLSFDACRYRKALLSDNGPVIVIAIH